MRTETIDIIGLTKRYYDLLEEELYCFKPNMYYTSKTTSYYNKLLKPDGMEITPKQPDGYVYIIKKLRV